MKRAFNLFLIACMLLQSVPVVAGNDMGQGGQDQSQGQGGNLSFLDTAYDKTKDGMTTQGDPGLFSTGGQEQQGAGGKDIGGNQQQQQVGGEVVIKPNPDSDVHQTPNPGNMVNYGQTYVFNSIAEYNAWARRQNEQHSNDPRDQARRRIEEARRRQELAQRQREQARRQRELARLQEQARNNHRRNDWNNQQQQQQQGGSYQAPENAMDLQWRRDLLAAQIERERMAMEREQRQQQWAMQQQAQERQWQMQQEQIQRQEQARRDAARAQQNIMMAQMFGMMIPMIVMASQSGKANSASGSGNYQYQTQPYPYSQQQYPQQQYQGNYYQMGK